jgi:hypothetical protein
MSSALVLSAFISIALASSAVPLVCLLLNAKIEIAAIAFLPAGPAA